MIKDIRYKGHIIRLNPIHGYQIYIGLIHISWANSIEDAKQIIDLLTEK